MNWLEKHDFHAYKGDDGEWKLWKEEPSIAHLMVIDKMSGFLFRTEQQIKDRVEAALQELREYFT